MKLRMTLTVLCAMTLPSVAGEDEAPARLSMDKTGLRWIEPFTNAHAAAKAQKRLLFVKPIAFGTKPNGCW